MLYFIKYTNTQIVLMMLTIRNLLICWTLCLNNNSQLKRIYWTNGRHIHSNSNNSNNCIYLINPVKMLIVIMVNNINPVLFVWMNTFRRVMLNLTLHSIVKRVQLKIVIKAVEMVVLQVGNHSSHLIYQEEQVMVMMMKTMNKMVTSKMMMINLHC